MNTQAAIFLCDLTGIMAEPWAEVGVQCFCIDLQHSIRKPRQQGNIRFVWGDVRSWLPPSGLDILFVGGFPPCTDVSVSGARDFATKGGGLLRDAIELFDASRKSAAWSGAPYFIENPVSVFSSLPHIGKPDHYFDPCDYAGYLPDAQQADDAYTKKTCIWGGNGFEMPKARRVEPLLGSKMWKLPPSNDRANQRAATPRGFARAVFESNAPTSFRNGLEAVA